MPRSLLACATSFAAGLLSAAPGHAQSLATNAPAPLSTRVVAYTLDAHIDPARHTLDATEILTYRNLTGQPLTVFPFHLYLNAFQPESTFTTEAHFSGSTRGGDSGDAYPDRKRGSITVDSLTAEGFGPLPLHFIAPDDHNAADRTVAEVPLPHPLAPGDAITFRMHFRDLFPESVARNGYKRDFLMGGQWFPKVGVFWHGQWNCHQYHATSEFFSDFGTYSVRLTLPRNFTVGASGVPTGERTNPDGTRTLSFYGEDIHDFAFAASPHFNVVQGTYLSSLGPVQVRVLALAAHPKAGPRYLAILLASLRQFEQRFGPYPYKILTLVDPEPGSEIGGMEYPTLITGDAGLLDPTETLEITAEHEFGHQYWYGMVATNEFEDAWLDEGINSYTEAAITGAILGPHISALNLPWANLSDATLHYGEYIAKPDYDPVTRPAWLFRNEASYGGISYGKSSILLATLEGIVGADTMAEAMRTWFQRFKFQHPTTEDFLRTLTEVAIRRGRATGIPGIQSTARMGAAYVVLDSPFAPFSGILKQPARPEIFIGSSLSAFFDQAVYGTAILDYAVDSIVNGQAHWANPKDRSGLNRASVTVHRIGDFSLPIDLAIRFSDGTRRIEHWDSTAGDNHRWHTFTYTTTATIASAEIDPGHTQLLDVDFFNNSKTIAANPVPARKLTTLWLSAMQLASQCAGYLI